MGGGPLSRAAALLPSGAGLPDDRWKRRHLAVLALLWVHLPLVFMFAFDIGDRSAGTLGVGLVAALAVAASLPLARRLRSVMAGLGLVAASLSLLDIGAGRHESAWHLLVVVGLLAIYADWVPLAAAVAVSVASLLLAPELAGADRLTLSGFVTAAGLAGLASARLAEPGAGGGPPELGRSALEEQEARRLRDELLAVASNELRNPLTTILGFSEVLLDDDERLTDAQRLNFVTRIATQARRLERLMTGVFDASEEADPSEPAHTHLSRTVRLILADVVDDAERDRVQVGRVLQGLCAGVPYRSLRLILGNLVDNGLRFARPDSAITLDVHQSEELAWVLVTCSVQRDPAILTDPRRLFEPLVQPEPSATGGAAWLGLGLHLVAQVAISYGGQVTVGGAGELVTFTVWLPAASHEPHAEQVPA